MWPRKSKQDRRVFAWISDTHAGSKTGLLNPETVLLRVDDEGIEEEWQPELSQTQRWLWPVYEKATRELADYVGDDELLIAHGGDITQGDKYSGRIPETTREDQRIIARDNLKPLLELKPTKVRLLTGTEVHVPECAEARVAARLRSDTGLDISVCHHARFDMGQEWVDGAHHGPYPGSRDWLRGNVALYYLKDRVYLDRRIGKEPAVAYMRGHYHQFVCVPFYDRWQGKERTHYVIVIPSFCGRDNFVRKIAQSPPIMQAGIVAQEFINGSLAGIKPFIEEIDLRTEEAL